MILFLFLNCILHVLALKGKTFCKNVCNDCSNFDSVLLLMNPQNDFYPSSLDNSFHGSISLPYALDDARQLINFISNYGSNINNMYVCMDTHCDNDISFPSFWQNLNGDEPEPFTKITIDDVLGNIWFPKQMILFEHVLDYIQTLNLMGKHHEIWPPHCVKNTLGHNVLPLIENSIYDWQDKFNKRVTYIPKGINPLTEMYSLFMAEVPDPNDPLTGLNINLLEELCKYKKIFVSGQPKTKCVQSTIEHLIISKNINPNPEIIFLKDTCSNMPGKDFESFKFDTLMKKNGVQIMKTTDF